MIESKRVDIADVLRGFAIMGIFLIHTIEHFNFYSFPEVDSTWMKFTDKAIWDAIFFTFSGKAYGIFALLFGFTFFIQDNNRLQKGADFRPRFAWRLVLLFIWGNINAMFFTGEILVFFSMMGFVLLFVARLSNKVVLIIASILMLQPIEWYKLLSALINPDYMVGESLVSYYFGEAYKVQMHGNFLETVRMNLWEGQLANFSYAWEYGRVFQTASLFMFGMLLGRTQLLLNTEKNLRFWKMALIISILAFFPSNGLLNLIPNFIDNEQVLSSLKIMLRSWSNGMFMVFMISLIINLYYSTRLYKLLGKFAPYGMMSLTAYMTQSVIGSFLFYNWGLGLHNKLSITYSFLLGIVLFLLQYSFACWWMKRHKHGPLEYIWRKATWIGAKNNEK